MLDMIVVVALLTKSSLAIYAACNFPNFSIKTIQKKDDTILFKIPL